ncbi:MAG: TonB-dependent receptor [Bacteroidia bacterium]|nr:TonB-dependent receptor [Bacteroidia bacterium]
MRKYCFLILLLFIARYSAGQSGICKGKIIDRVSNEALPFAVVVIEGTALGAVADIEGFFVINNLEPGTYNVKANLLGYKPLTIFDVRVNNSRAAVIRFELEKSSSQLNEAVITAEVISKTEESPVSLRTIGATEIKRNPGGNRDISKAIQSFPGVGFTASFRNDILVRGGSPNENRFYIDDIETPVINHFQTQGASGGPVGMINVDLISDLRFYAGAFPANRGNALSSVLDFKYKTLQDDKPFYSLTLGSSDLALTTETPVGKKSSLIAGYRKSYLQFLFKALELPFLPAYDDLQFKYQWKISTQQELNIIGIGALDKFELNKEANKTVEQRYLLNVLPINEQWNYTVGAVYKRFHAESYTTLVASRNHLNNEATKYFNNENVPGNLLYRYHSQEIENKMRWENTARKKGWKFNYGIGAEHVRYLNDTYQKQPFGITVDYSSDLSFIKHSAFGQVSSTMEKNKLILSLGARLDGNTFNDNMNNPLNQFSPRFSASYSLNNKWSVNFNTGLYNQLPPYTVLGYRNLNGDLVNKAVKYIEAIHFVSGVEFDSEKNLKITAELFHKIYSHYPFSLKDSVSLANLGSDFGVVGDVAVISNNQGLASGIEFLVQQKLFKNFYGLLSYTFVRSEFQDINGKYISSSWDFNNILSITAGKIFKSNWETGIRYRYSDGAPFSPYEVTSSLVKTNFDATGQGIKDYSKLNTLRSPSFSQLDLRIDKKYPFKKWTLNIYLDIQNVLNTKSEQQPYLSIQRDANGKGITDSDNPDSYLPLYIKNDSGTVLPSLGIIIEF